MIKRFLARLLLFLTDVEEITNNDELRDAYINSFNGAKNSVRMTVCEFEISIFENKLVCHAIRKALTRDNGAITIEILVGPDTPDISAFEALESFGNFAIHRMTKSPKDHVLVVDACDVILVGLHERNETHASILDNEPRFARRVLRNLRQVMNEG